MTPVLEVRNLTKHYPEFSLQQVSFTAPRGYIMGFIGPNGAGKTTTIKAILNLVRIDAGEIRLFGQNHRQEEKVLRQRVGFVLDENYYYEELSPAENGKIVSRFYQNWDSRSFQYYLQRFQIPARRKLKELSHGTKTKFSLAVALSHQAELILMDEPTSGLDPVFRSELLEILGDLIQDDQKAILFSTHITSDLDKVADYITFINQGRIHFSEEKDRVLEQYGMVKGGSDMLTPEFRRLLVGLREHRHGFEGLSKQLQAVRKLYRDQVTIEPANLEDIMLYTVRGNRDA